MSPNVDTPMTTSDPSPGKASYVLFPIEYHELWKAYKIAQSSFWTADQINLDIDREQWRSVFTYGERKFFSFILGYFAGADGILVENLALRFCSEADIPEVRCFYGYQIMIENVHAEVYSRCVQEFVEDPLERLCLFGSIKSTPIVMEKAQWCAKWTESSDISSLATRIVAFAIVEGIFFSSSFASMFWLRHRNLMPGLISSNELIARDEGQHTAFTCLLYRHMRTPIPDEDVQDMVREAVALEQEFFEDALLGCNIPGLTQDRMDDYIEYVADVLLSQLGCEMIYLKENPFTFVDSPIDAGTDFFE